MNAKLVPGAAFTIVSAGALLSNGVSVKSQTSCANSFIVGGQTFTSEGTGQQKPFSALFAEGCSTAFADLSERLSASQWAQVVKEFGIGADWSQLPVPAFSGSVPSAAGDDATLAAQTIGQGSVRMSLLSMAMVAAAVDTGHWHVPQVVQAPAGAPAAGAPLDPDMTSALQGLMRGAVRSGAAQAASLPGRQVYGQVGLVHSRIGLDELVRRLPRRHRDRRDRVRQDGPALGRRPGRRLLLGPRPLTARRPAPPALGTGPFRPASQTAAHHAAAARQPFTPHASPPSLLSVTDA